MKIQCDVCNRDEASVFCCADEAALCDVCDNRVHHANKLAGKHQRFSLLPPSCAANAPLCDVCQERRAFLFCQQDRAILCRDCDIPIHTASDLTQKHHRFLLTGVKLSPINNNAASSSISCSFPVADRSKSLKKPVAASPEISHPPPIAKTSSASSMAMNKAGGDCLIPSEGGSTSSISEYLMEMLPGWHFEDFFDSSSAAHGFCKSDVGLWPFPNGDLESTLSPFSTNSAGIWVPQARPPQSSQYSSLMARQIGMKESQEAASMKTPRRWTEDALTVPQISPPSKFSKRSRPF